MIDEENSIKDLDREMEKLRNINLELEATIRADKVTINNLVKSRSFLSQTALELVELPHKADIYEFLAIKLNNLVPNSITTISAYDEHSQSFRVRAVAGFRETMEKISKKFLGQSALDVTTPLSDLNKESKRILLTGELTKMEEGVYQVLNGKVPKKICKIIERMAGIGDIYAIGLIWNGKIYGIANISLKKGNELENRETVETFLKMASVVLQRKKAEEQIIESEEIYRKLLRESFDAWVIHGDGNILAANNTAARIMGGKSSQDIIGKSVLEFVHPDYRETVQKRTIWLYKEGGTVPLFEEKFLKLDGTPIDVEVVGTSLKYKGKTAVQVVFHDITHRKNAEEKIKKSLEEKEMLLKEIHHRVKNNLMVISSLLNLQSRYIKDKAALDVFRESQNRAKSMALIHEKLYRSSDLKNIDFGEYIRTLSADLYHTYLLDPSSVKLNLNVKDIMLDINTAIPLGLIVNELLTNSMKHAFPECLSGTITVEFNKKAENFILKVSDDGIGLPDDFDINSTETLGLQLVNSLTGQIDGQIELDRAHGTKFKVTFKEEKFAK